MVKNDKKLIPNPFSYKKKGLKNKSLSFQERDFPERDGFAKGEFKNQAY
jgi:hypothetical protein